MNAHHYTPGQIAPFVRSVQGVEIYLGGATEFRAALLRDGEMTREVFRGVWTANAHRNTAIPMNSSADEEGDDEMYGIAFDGDGNSVHGDDQEAGRDVDKQKPHARESDVHTNSSDDSSQMSEELIYFSETDTIDYAVKPCGSRRSNQHLDAGDCKHANRQTPADDNIESSKESVHFDAETDSMNYATGSILEEDDMKSSAGNRTIASSRCCSSLLDHDRLLTMKQADEQPECESKASDDIASHDESESNIRHAECTNKPANPIETKSSNRQTSSSSAHESTDPDAWHSRRTSLDVIKKRSQLKRDRAAAVIQKQYNRITSFASGGESKSSGGSKRPRLKFMAAPGMKDEKKKQMTLMGMFKK